MSKLLRLKNMHKLEKSQFANAMIGSGFSGKPRRRRRKRSKTRRSVSMIRNGSSDYGVVSQASSDPMTQAMYQNTYGGAFASQVQMSSPFRTIAKKTKSKKGKR